MKTSRSTTTKQNKQGPSKKPRPEIRDDMDSRHVKEGKENKKGKPIVKSAPDKKK
ncbi:MAG TPA: hypothetical protein VGF30_11970 [Bacteroidia bacterium]